ncbi:hypothetical protein O9K51_03868 [Purpureocillium lavendulum]|uniref:Uncharacterized protein n=1 Tax=Purpureocillium lavendulum TaxID=1247861 RepID=A0AB34FT68_9HYPO|nr:hypothetical protein O9K51_03868 [Purpureocillium lavendulum]
MKIGYSALVAGVVAFLGSGVAAAPVPAAAAAAAAAAPENTMATTTVTRTTTGPGRVAGTVGYVRLDDRIRRRTLGSF